MSRKIEVKQVKKIYIHNDLMNVAFHMKEQILFKHSHGQEGIDLEILAALTMLAFAFEAKINFVGQKVVNKWKERESFKKKSSKIYSELELSPNLNERPFSSVEKLKKFRDFVAHGKPIDICIVTEGEADGYRPRVDLKAGYEEICTIENFLEIYADVKEVWRIMLDAADIPLIDTITTGSTTHTLIDP